MNDIGREDAIALIRPVEGRAAAAPGPVPPPRGGDRRVLFEERRCVAVHLATAGLLERRAALATSPVIAALLTERAARHRQAADRMRLRRPHLVRG